MKETRYNSKTSFSNQLQSGKNSRYIRITSDRQHQTGWLWSRLPLTATNWEIEFEFKISGAGTLYGDGMALWVTKERATSGPVFGSVNNFDGLGKGI